MRVPRGLVSTHHINTPWLPLAALLVLAAVLQFAGAVGLSYVAGFSAVLSVAARADWPWLVGCAASLVLSFVGYYYAYTGIYRVENGPGLSARQLRAVVAAGFGGFLAHGGGALDKFALEAAGADEREASVRVSALAGLEHGVLALGGTGAAIVVLVQGLGKPPGDFSLPWAIIPVPGFLVAFWLADRYRERLRSGGGWHDWRGHVGVFADSIHVVEQFFVRVRTGVPVVLGMAAYWAAEGFSVWAGLRAFGFAMNPAALFVGYATGLVFTRRTGPLGGAGVLMCVLPMTIFYSGAPLAVAVVGVFAYRVLSLWLPLPVSLGYLPLLRQLGHESVPGAEDTGSAQGEPALEHGAA
jgi:hypothetical protein